MTSSTAKRGSTFGSRVTSSKTNKHTEKNFKKVWVFIVHMPDKFPTHITHFPLKKKKKLANGFIIQLLNRKIVYRNQT